MERVCLLGFFVSIIFIPLEILPMMDDGWVALKIVTELARLLFRAVGKKNATADLVVAINRFRIVGASSDRRTVGSVRCWQRRQTDDRWTLDDFHFCWHSWWLIVIGLFYGVKNCPITI